MNSALDEGTSISGREISFDRLAHSPTFASAPRDQTTENGIREIAAAGFTVDRKRVVSETVSGSAALEQRPGFVKLLDRLDEGDVLIVTKMDRLGRDTIDVVQTVKRLKAMEVRVHCLALGGMDLTKAPPER